MEMCYVASYLLATLRGNASVQCQGHQEESGQVSIKADDDWLDKVIRELNGKVLKMSLPWVLASWPVCPLVGLWLCLLSQDLHLLLLVPPQWWQRRRKRRKGRSQSQLTMWNLTCSMMVPFSCK